MLDNFFSTAPTDTLISEPHTLAVLSFRQDSDDGTVPAKLSTLTSTDNEPDSVVEVWNSDEHVTDSGTQGNCHWRSSEHFLFVAVDLHCDVADDLEKISEQAYLSILQTIKTSDCQKLLRFWNILPRINVGDGDNENYKRFCNGRLDAFREFDIHAADYPAATAVGHYGTGLSVYAIATKLDPVHSGNPRQVDAFEYPRRYGPSSPSFARATCLAIPDTSHRLFFVSGTASIVGHESVHVGDLASQLRTTNDNILFLLEEAGLKGRDIRSMRVYLRHPADAGVTRDTVSAWYPDAQIIITHADICRAELLVEIECFCMAA